MKTYTRREEKGKWDTQQIQNQYTISLLHFHGNSYYNKLHDGLNMECEISVSAERPLGPNLCRLVKKKRCDSRSPILSRYDQCALTELYAA